MTVLDLDNSLNKLGKSFEADTVKGDLPGLNIRRRFEAMIFR